MKKAATFARKVKKWLQFFTILNLAYFLAATSYWSSVKAASASNMTCFGKQQDKLSGTFENNTVVDDPSQLSFMVDEVEDNYIVKFDGYYYKQNRLHYLDEALKFLELNSSQWGVLPHTGTVEEYPSDFDVLQVDPSILIEVSLPFNFQPLYLN